MERFFEVGKFYKLPEYNSKEFIDYYSGNLPIFNFIGNKTFKVKSFDQEIPELVVQINGADYCLEFNPYDDDWKFFLEVDEPEEEIKYKIGRKEGKCITILDTKELTEETARLLISVLITETSNEYCLVSEL
ncbi:hypothetical protein [Providencia phage PSTRCR_121]|nr:hypothetical protein [Providencia phage PSTRCR_121]